MILEWWDCDIGIVDVFSEFPIPDLESGIVEIKAKTYKIICNKKAPEGAYLLLTTMHQAFRV